MKVKVTQSCPALCDPRGLYRPWNLPGQNTEVSSLSLFQGIFPSQGSNPGLPHCRRILFACISVRIKWRMCPLCPWREAVVPRSGLRHWGTLTRRMSAPLVWATVRTVARTMSKRTPSEVSKIKQLLKDKPEDFPTGPVAKTSH